MLRGPPRTAAAPRLRWDARAYDGPVPDADPSAPRRGHAGAAGPVTTPELAPFGRRLLALCLDWAIAMAIAYGFLDGDAFAILGIFALQRILVGGLLGSSIGHRVAGLRLVAVDRGRAPFHRGVVRAVLLCRGRPGRWRTVDGVPLHDDLARTRLVRAR